jgi:hypothetical protein
VKHKKPVIVLACTQHITVHKAYLCILFWYSHKTNRSVVIPQLQIGMVGLGEIIWLAHVYVWWQKIIPEPRSSWLVVYVVFRVNCLLWSFPARIVAQVQLRRAVYCLDILTWTLPEWLTFNFDLVRVSCLYKGCKSLGQVNYGSVYQIWWLWRFSLS